MRSIPRAISWVAIAVFAIYFTLPWIALSAMPVVHEGTHYVTQLGQPPPHGFKNDPVLGLVENLGLHGAVLTIAKIYVGILAATILFIATNAGVIGASRITYSMASYRQLPEAFRRLHPKLKTPWLSLVVFAGLGPSLFLLSGQVGLPRPDVRLRGDALVHDRAPRRRRRCARAGATRSSSGARGRTSRSAASAGRSSRSSARSAPAAPGSSSSRRTRRRATPVSRGWSPASRSTSSTGDACTSASRSRRARRSRSGLRSRSSTARSSFRSSRASSSREAVEVAARLATERAGRIVLLRVVVVPLELPLDADLAEQLTRPTGCSTTPAPSLRRTACARSSVSCARATPAARSSRRPSAAAREIIVLGAPRGQPPQHLRPHGRLRPQERAVAGDGRRRPKGGLSPCTATWCSRSRS